MALPTAYDADPWSVNETEVLVDLWFNDSSVVSLEELYGSGGSGKGETVALVAVYVPVMVVAVVGNMMVLGVVLMDRRMRKSAPNFFLCNLALADLLVGLFCIPITAARYLYEVWVFGDVMCKATGYLQGISIVASVLTIVCMAADRYFAILHPMRNRQIFSVRRVKQLIVLTWLMAAVIVIPLLVVRKVEHYHLGLNQLAGNSVVLPEVSVQYCTEAWPSDGSRQVYDCLLLGVVYVLPGSLTVCLYARIGTALCATDQNLTRSNSNVTNETKMVLARRRLALMMIVLSVLFAVCWLPYTIINLCLNFHPAWSPWLLPVYPFSVLLGHSNSAQNPLLYCLMHRAFQHTASRIVRCHWTGLFRKSTASRQQTERTQLQGSQRTSHRDSARRDVTPPTPHTQVNAV